MSATRRGSARPLFLELAALGVDPSTGYVPDLDLTCGQISVLMRRLRENRQGLREVLSGDDGDVTAIREEAL